MNAVLKTALVLSLLAGVATPVAAQPGLLGLSRQIQERQRQEQGQQPPAPPVTPPAPRPPEPPPQPRPPQPRPPEPPRPQAPRPPPVVVVVPSYPSYGAGYGGPSYGGPIYGSPWNDPFDDRYRDQDWDRPRYEAYRYPREIWSNYRYDWRGPTYRDPPGFSFRLSFGDTLARSWYGPSRYMDDWWRYGLADPPVGMEWVRLGRDAVLFDRLSGRVYQVVREVFW